MSFVDYTSGLRESVQRLNPSQNPRPNSKELKEQKTRMIARAASTRKPQGQSSAKHQAMITHEKRLEKLHKLRSKLKDHSKEQANKHHKDEHGTHGLSLKRRKSKVSCQEYKIVTSDKSFLDLKIN